MAVEILPSIPAWLFPLDAANVDTDAIIPKQFFAEGYAHRFWRPSV